MPLPDAYASCLVRINLKKSPAADGAHTGGCCCFVLKGVITTDYSTNTSISAKIAAVTSTVEALCVREGKVMSAYKGTASELTLLSKLIQTQRAHTYDSINKLIQHQTAKHL